MRSIISSLLLLFSAGLCAQINPGPPATGGQINWPVITGSGAPSGGACTSANYGQPYTQTTGPHQFVCTPSGWYQTDLGGTNTTIGFIMNTGLTGTNVGPMLAASHVGSITKCVILTKASDGSTGLTVDIKQNGTSVFSAPISVSAGTSTGTLTSFSLSSGSLAVAQGDIFQINISSGTANWQFTAQLE